MLHDDERGGWHFLDRAKKGLQGLQAAGGGADAHDGERQAVGRPAVAPIGGRHPSL